MSSQSLQRIDRLTARVLEYQALVKKTNLNANELQKRTQLGDYLIQTVWLIAYRYPVTVKILDEEDAAEFILCFYRRIPVLVNEFRYEYISFESYLKKVVFWQSNSFLKRKRRRENRCPCDPNDPETIQHLITDDQYPGYDSPYRNVASESLISEQPVLFGTDETWDFDTRICKLLKKRMKTSRTLKNRLLQLILLCCDRLNALQIAQLAHFLSIEEDRLAHLISQALEIGDRRMQIDTELRQIRDAHFQEYLRSQGEMEMLESLCADAYYVDRMRRRAERAKDLFVLRCKESRSRPSAVTHAAVAAVLSIPKGTVDSGMLSLRRLLYQLMDDNG
ncbi:MAG: hypothetical protein WC129_00585 [Sphaerochaetaceae bacterium]|nr:hypothetical protein [Sphaerochaetaceae bacterium]MDX9808939.1 hypothetical protein [Sphaerochaetaceae bacterium]NLV83143.1 hypothetical protein [Spirochaetales bacterium]